MIVSVTDPPAGVAGAKSNVTDQTGPGAREKSNDTGVTDHHAVATAENGNDAGVMADDAPAAPGNRNAEESSEDSWARIVAESRERTRKKKDSQRSGDTCHKCFEGLMSREYAHGDSVYQHKEYGETFLLCYSCAPRVLAEEGRITPVVEDGLGKAYQGSPVAHELP
jgi:hypothetical protein